MPRKKRANKRGTKPRPPNPDSDEPVEKIQRSLLAAQERVADDRDRLVDRVTFAMIRHHRNRLRVRMLKRLTVLALALLILAVAVFGLIQYFGAPNWQDLLRRIKPNL